MIILVIAYRYKGAAFYHPGAHDLRCALPVASTMTKKAIGLAEFNELSQELQFELLHRDGVYVGKRKVGNQVIILLQLYGFYVEVHYKQYRKKVEHLIVSGDTDMLQPYMDQIKVKGLDKGSGTDL